MPLDERSTNIVGKTPPQRFAYAFLQGLGQLLVDVVDQLVLNCIANAFAQLVAKLLLLLFPTGIPAHPGEAPAGLCKAAVLAVLRAAKLSAAAHCAHRRLDCLIQLLNVMGCLCHCCLSNRSKCCGLVAAIGCDIPSCSWFSDGQMVCA